MPELVLPSIEYKTSFLTALDEYHQEKLPYYLNLDKQFLSKHFETFLAALQAEAIGKHLKPGRVPHTVYWLVEQAEYLGRVDIRHQLTDKLRTVGGHIGYDIRPSKRRQGYGTVALQLGIEKAKSLGIQSILVTCDVTNIGSNKIIQKNGGQLFDTVPVAKGRPDKNKYWIHVS